MGRSLTATLTLAGSITKLKRHITKNIQFHFTKLKFYLQLNFNEKTHTFRERPSLRVGVTERREAEDEEEEEEEAEEGRSLEERTEWGGGT